MIQLPKNERDPKETAKLCQCRPICKSRRREWKGEVQNTSAELLLERKPLAECFRRWPMKVYPNGPCPLLGRTRHITIKEKNTFTKRDVVRICEAPVDDQVDTPYLRLAEMAQQLGACNMVKACCPFCACGHGACPCSKDGYMPRDADRALLRRTDMRQFDRRVKTAAVKMKIMYDNP